MPPRKERVPVVLDTNVFAGYYLSKVSHSTNGRMVRLWRDQRRLQLIVSDAVVTEYIEVLRRLGVAEPRLKRFVERLQRRESVTHVNLGPRFAASRDPDDNLMLATAAVGKAKFLVTNDHDLLDLAPAQRRAFKFRIVTPSSFLTHLAPARF